MEYVNILHLSDLHIGNFRYDDPETLAINIKNVLEDHNRAVDLVVFTGDVFDGRSTTREKDVDNAVKFFNAIIIYLNETNLSDAPLTTDDIIFVPGNHDLVRDDANQYSKFDQFLNTFYPAGHSNKIISVDKYNFVCDFPAKKIAILGFNSCKVKTETIKEADLKWIKNLDLSGISCDVDNIRKAIRENREREVRWDDYGYIEPKELNSVFTNFKAIAKNFSDYNVIAVFHHHFYPFPEISSGKPDASFIRNYTDVMNQFQRHGVKLVLHGHKHLSIHRAVTDQRYFEDPESLVYVLSAGSIGCKDVYNPSFQWIRVFSKDHNRLAEGEKYDYKDQQLENVKRFVLPPQGADEKAISINLLENLATDDPKLYKEYEKLTNLFEQIILDNKINHLIDVIGRLFTIFNDIKTELRTKPLINYMIMLTLNYRTIFLRNYREPDEQLEDLLAKIESALGKHLEEKFSADIIAFMKAVHKEDLEKKYLSIIKNVSSSNKKVSAYCSIALFMADLFLNISDYGEYYFTDEKLNHKINIKLNKGVFYNAIPSDSLTISGDIERRAITINFKSKNPTAHKVAVLIVKDFEMRLDKFEDSLKEIKLKLYYITPKVQVDNYDLENFHFDAYIPTLLPLLTGDNLYKSKEVFIRELVQNAIDATLFRKQLQPSVNFDSQINIELGSVVRDGEKVKFFRITDKGTGMSKFTIERYFTSIGRSFYVSEEFDEIKKDKRIQYSAISNFGIGFLSCFMVCKEILVKTKNIIHEDGVKGLEIEIPNYDGCFFIREDNLSAYGTEITLFEDERKLFDTKRFIAYMKDTFNGLPLPLHIQKPGGKKNDLKIEAYSKQKEMLAMAQTGEKYVFYVPFNEKEKTIGEISWNKYVETDIKDLNPFGIWVDFDDLTERNDKNQVSVSNQGLKVSTPYVPIKLEFNKYSPKIHLNFPSSFIQLDVSRETILNLNEQIDFEPFYPSLAKQIKGFMEEASTNKVPLQLSKLSFVQAHLHFIENKSFNILEWPLSFLIEIEIISEGFTFRVIDRREIKPQYNPLEFLYFDFYDEHNSKTFLDAINSIKIKAKNLKKGLIGEKELFDLRNDVEFQHQIYYKEEFRNYFQHQYYITKSGPSKGTVMENYHLSWSYFEHDFVNSNRNRLRLKQKPEKEDFKAIFLTGYFNTPRHDKPEFSFMFQLALLHLKNVVFAEFNTENYKSFSLTIKRSELGL